jgi:MSHA biogenesis protein MshN
VSVLNTMLQDLERRGARPAAASTTAATPASPAAPATPDRAAAAWIDESAPASLDGGPWRLTRGVLIVSLLALLAGAGWYLFKGAQPPARPAALPPQATAALAAPSTVPRPVAAALVAAPSPGATPAPQAQALNSPAPRSPAKTPAPAKTGVDATPRKAHAFAAVPAPAPAASVAISSPQADLARASDLIARGQASEAESILASVLDRKPALHEARFALAALLAERSARRQALGLLLGGVAIDPARFAPTAAQLQAELGDPDGALVTLDRVDAAARSGAVHALAGGIAQRAGHHERAIEEYQGSLRSEPAPALSWVGLGVSLQAVGRTGEAAEAYRNALQGSLSPQVRRFAGERLREALAAAAR